MGVWGTQPWENDTAADWFIDFGKSIDIKLIEKTLNMFNKDIRSTYHQTRAVAHILECIAENYVWPGKYEDLFQILEKALDNLNVILNDQEFINSWLHQEDRVQIIESLNSQIETLLKFAPKELKNKYELNTNQLEQTI